jgi:hypothetical protein
LAGVAAIVLAIAGCTLLASSGEPQFPDISGPSISVAGRSVRVSGQADLPDGARMDFIAVQGCDVGRCVEETSSAVLANGKYEATFNLAGWPAGTHYLWVEFHPSRNQPRAVHEKYGVDGSKMTGRRVRPEDDDSGWQWFHAYEFTLN